VSEPDQRVKPLREPDEGFRKALREAMKELSTECRECACILPAGVPVCYECRQKGL